MTGCEEASFRLSSPERISSRVRSDSLRHKVRFAGPLTLRNVGAKSHYFVAQGNALVVDLTGARLDLFGPFRADVGLDGCGRQGVALGYLVAAFQAC